MLGGMSSCGGIMASGYGLGGVGFQHTSATDWGEL
jgi:hypothetical protein